MFEHLFTYPGVLAPHRRAPAVAERESYLQHCAKQGMARGTLMSIANELRVIAGRPEVAGGKPIAHEQIVTASERWARRQRRSGRSAQLRWSRERFIHAATDWMGFLNRLETEAASPADCLVLSDEFLRHLREERGLSPRTIHVQKF